MKKHQPFHLDHSTRNHNNSSWHSLADKPWFVAFLVATAFTTGLLVSSAFQRESSSSDKSLLCSLTGAYTTPQASATPSQLSAILHYSTSRVVPQQSLAEIRLTFNVLQTLAPCNFLVFGIGHDSLMWASFNPHGTTLFLEEDPKWIHKVLKNFPNLSAHVVKYPTRLSQAEQLLLGYRDQDDCMPPDLQLKGNTRCKLALDMLPEEVYEREWDVIMIDGPRGYFAEAPGRMGAIYTAAVMARTRTRPGATHVFLHDVNRRVEKLYAEEFLCKEYLVRGAGRLWHFEIPPAAAAANDTSTRTSTSISTSFC